MSETEEKNKITAKAPSTNKSDQDKSNFKQFKPEDDIRKYSPFRSQDKSTFTLNDINYYNGYWNYASSKEGVIWPEDKLIVKELQPDFRFDWSKVALETADAVKGGFQEFGKALFKTLIKSSGSERAAAIIESEALAKGANAAKTGVEQKLSEVAINNMVNSINRSKENAQTLLYKDPVSLVKNLLTGNYVYSYEIPSAIPTYLNIQQGEYWSASDLSTAGGGDGFLSRNGFNFSTTPTFKIGAGGNYHPEPITISLTLYNNNLDNLMNNYIYLNCLAHGAFFTQVSTFQKSTNLYDISIPGRFTNYFCTMDMVATYHGQTRMLSKGAGDKLIARLTDNNKFGINENMIRNNLFPDAYKLELVFKSLAPNSFNMYLNYITNLSETDKIEDNTFIGITEEITAGAVNIAKAAKDTAAENLGSGSEGTRTKLTG